MNPLQVLRRVYLYGVWLVALAGVSVGLTDALALGLSAWAGRAIWGEGARLAWDLAALAVAAPVAAWHWAWAQRLVRRSPQERAAWSRALALHGARLAAEVAVITAVGALAQWGLARLLGDAWAPGAGLWPRWVAQGVVFAALAGGLALVQRHEAGRAHQVVGTLHAWMLWWLAWAFLAQGWRHGWRWLLQGTGAPAAWGVRWLLGVALVLGLWPWWQAAWRGRLAAPRWHAGATLLTVTTWALLAWGMLGWALEIIGQGVLGEWTARGWGWPDLGEALLNALFWGLLTWGMFQHWQRGPARREEVPALLWAYRAVGVLAAAGGLTWAFGLAALWTAAWKGGTWRPWWAHGLALALAGSGLWAWGWRYLSRKGQGQGLRADLGRKGYLYFGLFVALMVGMALAVELLYRFFGGFLGEGWPEGVFWAERIGHLALALGLAWWHRARLREDEVLEEQQAGQRLQAWRVILLSDGTAPLLGRLHERLRQLLPEVRVVWHDVRQGLPEAGQQVDAVVLPGNLLFALDETWRLWLQRLQAPQLILPGGGPWVWLGVEADEERLVQEAVAQVQQLAAPVPATVRWRWWQWAVAVPLALVWGGLWLAVALGG